MINRRYRHYFAYGSNLNSKDLEIWCRKRGYTRIKWKCARKAILEDHRLVFNYYSNTRQSAVANIEPSTGDIVEGMLFEIGEETLCKLDHKEGHPSCYTRFNNFIQVVLEDKSVHRAFTYTVIPEKAGEDLKPSKQYLQIIKHGAKEWGLSKDWIEKLQGIERTLDETKKMSR